MVEKPKEINQRLVLSHEIVARWLRQASRHCHEIRSLWNRSDTVIGVRMQDIIICGRFSRIQIGNVPPLQWVKTGNVAT